MTASTYADAPVRPFPTSSSVVDFFRNQITHNGDPALAGLEEEIIVVDQTGLPINHNRFQEFLGDFIRALPDGEVIAGPSVHGDIIPVLRGSFAGGLVQPETNTTLVELAHAPARTAWGCFEQSRDFTRQLMQTASAHALLVLGGGVVPTISMEDLLSHDAVIPNADFIYSWTHMTQGTRPEYCRTVFGTASIHHNMGFNDPDVMARYISTSLRLQPTMIALLANGPLWNNRLATIGGRQLLSHRSDVLLDYGNIYGYRDGLDYLYPDFLLDPNATFESIVDGYLDTPLDRTIVGGRKISCNGMTMREYFAGYSMNGQTHYPDEAALTMMIREPIVDVRPNFTGSAPRVETRAHDGVSQHVAVSVDAFYRGIAANLGAARVLTSGMDASEVRLARTMTCRQGLQTPLFHADPAITTQQDMAVSLLQIAEDGLLMRGYGEETLLAPLWTLATSGKNPAQRLRSVYRQAACNMTKVMRAMDYSNPYFADGTAYPWPSGPSRVTNTRQVKEALTCNR
ncbi:MAG TPA: hypothetical protein DCY07_00030 [Rhodospirillaceae bacterium]|nr:hypothetical protein [Rhodospirillaceae bacterium]